MEGGTTFHFVTEGIHSAFEQALNSAAGMDVRLGGGVSTIRQYLTAKLIDVIHVVISPNLLGSGERLFSNIDLVSLGYNCTDHVSTDIATHYIIRKIL